MLVSASHHVTVEGHVSAGFESVRDIFAENFARRGELGGACCAYLHGAKVVDLWGGVRSKRTGEAWAPSIPCGPFARSREALRKIPRRPRSSPHTLRVHWLTGERAPLLHRQLRKTSRGTAFA